MKTFHTLLFVSVLTACSGALTPTEVQTTLSPTSTPVEGGAEPAARAIFEKDNFTDLSDFVTPIYTQYTCLGDMVKTYHADGEDYLGTPTSFPSTYSGDALSPTTRPLFLKHISVDVTNTYYSITQGNVMASDACSYRTVTGAPEPSSCADFDEAPAVAPAPTVAPTATPNPSPFPVATPSTPEFYGTRYYRVRDDWCTNQGPVRNADTETSKTYVGGVNIDIDRTKLGAREDLMMMITYQALNRNASWPGVQTVNDKTILKVNLVATLGTLSSLMSVRQPRAWTDYRSTAQPVIISEIATLEDPFGSLRTEQVYLPVSQNVLIDRIRIDRVRGSYHLYQIDLYRLGNRGN